MRDIIELLPGLFLNASDTLSADTLKLRGIQVLLTDDAEFVSAVNSRGRRSRETQGRVVHVPVRGAQDLPRLLEVVKAAAQLWQECVPALISLRSLGPSPWVVAALTAAVMLGIQDADEISDLIRQNYGFCLGPEDRAELRRAVQAVRQLGRMPKKKAEVLPALPAPVVLVDASYALLYHTFYGWCSYLMRKGDITAKEQQLEISVTRATFLDEYTNRVLVMVTKTVPALVKKATGHKVAPADLVIALDCKHEANWRLAISARYKENRADRSQQQPFDERVYAHFYDVAIPRLKAAVPGLRVLKHRHAEADDIIAVVARDIASRGREVVIVANDGDYAQLCADPKRLRILNLQGADIFLRSCAKASVDPADPHAASTLLQHKILAGDASDNVNSVFCARDAEECPVPGSGARVPKKKQIVRKAELLRLAASAEARGGLFRERPELRARYAENQQLVDMGMLRPDIRGAILQKWQRASPEPLAGPKGNQ
ncbi:hypothetical protein HXX76_014049 [Chlamydomonas incerta]|uniref:5'-3' exonuclease domain-containing protein n=1 Tax=Chlamydomonas incerta TaxID=51695 RepID=A0A835SG37_CHLIN|nr:hypothetical protein HXX76_014049 [Chlamydomonas incerta]|eukprot:KAG2424891.1 hypothetical protein HXX76_014049 [Chlamydomonas incerta]